MKIKIAIIGAGSSVFSLNLIRDICMTPNLKDSTICFMDIDKDRLDTAYLLCKRFSGEVGISLRLEKTTDRRKALRGADFVINTALAASHDRLQEGWQIAREKGYGFGGLHILHDEAFWINFYQLKLMEALACDMLEICPKAWLVLVANPVQAGVTYLKRKYGDLNVVGMCHGFGGAYYLAETLGLEKKYVTFEAPGVNHFIWMTKFHYKGENAFPILDRWIAEREKNGWEDYKKGLSDHNGPKPADLYKRFGAFPIGDTATPGGGSWGYWYHSDSETEKRWREDPWGWYRKYFSEGLKHVEDMQRIAMDSSKMVSETFRLEHSNEPMIPLIEALACDVERTVIVNIQNDGGFVPGIPVDYEVEVPAIVNRKGIKGIKTDGLPAHLLSYLRRDRIAPVEMELQAYEKGDRKLLLSLIMMDPYTKSEKQASGLLEGILAMPCHKEMQEHYK